MAPLLLAAVLLAAALADSAGAAPYVPASDSAVLVELPAGTRHVDGSARRLAQQRLDVALPMAQFYIQRSRATGDLRYLGYAEAVLAPWIEQTRIDRSNPSPQALVLHATVQQSLHQFDAALATLDRALALRPDDAQGWLTRATVLRVMGRYPEAADACEHFAAVADVSLSALCRESLRALNGELAAAYQALRQAPMQGLLPAERAWMDAELGEMAVRLGRDSDAERWFLEDLRLSPEDFYVRAAYADLLLKQRRAAEVLKLLHGQDSLEPLLLRIAIAQKMLGDPGFKASSAALEAAFDAEARRGDAVHRREQARFLLEVQGRPDLALAAAALNWNVQREPDDVLVFINAAASAGNPDAARPALDFVRAHGLTDARLSKAGTL
jgi:tetratricopeptide (TPR) repeat protein